MNNYSEELFPLLHKSIYQKTPELLWLFRCVISCITQINWSKNNLYHKHIISRSVISYYTKTLMDNLLNFQSLTQLLLTQYNYIISNSILKIKCSCLLGINLRTLRSWLQYLNTGSFTAFLTKYTYNEYIYIYFKYYIVAFVHIFSKHAPDSWKLMQVILSVKQKKINSNNFTETGMLANSVKEC